MIKDIKREIIILSQNINDKLKEKYEMEFTNVKFIHSDLFHDRFIILDREILYTCGSSFKDMGKKCFIISKLNSKEILEGIIKQIFN